MVLRWRRFEAAGSSPRARFRVPSLGSEAAAAQARETRGEAATRFVWWGSREYFHSRIMVGHNTSASS